MSEPEQNEQNQTLAHSLLPLRLAYLERLKVYLESLGELNEALEKGETPSYGLQQLHRATHNFAGSGATFGFPDISKTARELHHVLKALFDSEDVPHQRDARKKVNTAFADFLHACHQALAVKEHVTAIALEEEAGSVNTVESKLVAVYAPEPELAHETVQQLQHFGYQVIVAEHIQRLASVPTSELYAMIAFTDLSFAQIMQLQQFQQSQPRSTSLPLIVISSRDDFDTRLAAVRIGAQGYFQRPADVLRVIDKIEQLAARYAIAPSYRVLVVDDDEMLAEFYSQTLHHAGMVASRVTNPKDAIAAFASQAVDLVLIDFTMPNCSGQELASIIRQYERHVSLPIIFMSAKEDLEMVLHNTGLGIDEVLTKPFTAEQLVSVVTSRARRAAELRSLMVRDGFTGLINHAHFLELLATEMNAARRAKMQAAYVILDIDHFKSINDTYGHAAGDQVIKSLTRMLQQRLRRGDILGRCGGEEFGIILPNCNLDNAQTVVESLRQKFAASPYMIGEHKINVTFSAGVAAVTHYANLDELINEADKALYQAKSEGRNRVCLARPQLTEEGAALSA